MVQDIHKAATTHPCVTHPPIGATIVCHVCHHRLSLQLEAEATHRVITIANRVSGPAHHPAGGGRPTSMGVPVPQQGCRDPQGAGVPWRQPH